MGTIHAPSPADTVPTGSPVKNSRLCFFSSSFPADSCRRLDIVMVADLTVRYDEKSVGGRDFVWIIRPISGWICLYENLSWVRESGRHFCWFTVHRWIECRGWRSSRLVAISSEVTTEVTTREGLSVPTVR